MNLAEAVDVLRCRDGRPAEQLRAVLDLLVDVVLDVLPVDEPMAWRAALLRERHSHRSSSPLSLADCVLLAAAGTDDIVASADEPLVRAARAEDIGIVTLGRCCAPQPRSDERPPPEVLLPVD